jgi:predicted dehydrogenase
MAYPLLIDMAIHHFDIARDLIGSQPVSAYCESYNPDWSWFRGNASAEVIFEFGGGPRFSYCGSWCSPGLETSWNGRWRLTAAGGAAVWDGDHEPVADAAAGETIEAAVQDEPEEIAGSLAEFVRVLRTGAVPSGEVHSNVLSLAMVEAAIVSAEERRRVTIEEVLEDAYATAVRVENRDDVRAALQGWPSVLDAVGMRH